LKNYIINVDNEHMSLLEEHNGLDISQKQYTELLSKLNDIKETDAILKCQTFSCGVCKSFSVSFEILYTALKKIAHLNEVAEIITFNLIVGSDVDPIYYGLHDLPVEIREKSMQFMDDEIDFQEQDKMIRSGNFLEEEGELYQIPFEKCAFVFDAKCSCNQILS
jgi:hypothetical protein